jgi:hypothetical protein
MTLERYNPSYFPSNRAKIEVVMLKEIILIEVRDISQVDSEKYKD